MMKERVGVLGASIHPLFSLHSDHCSLFLQSWSTKAKLASPSEETSGPFGDSSCVFLDNGHETGAWEREGEVINFVCVWVSERERERKSLLCTNSADTFLLWKALHTICWNHLKQIQMNLHHWSIKPFIPQRVHEDGKRAVVIEHQYQTSCRWEQAGISSHNDSSSRPWVGLLAVKSVLGRQSLNRILSYSQITEAFWESRRGDVLGSTNRNFQKHSLGTGPN